MSHVAPEHSGRGCTRCGEQNGHAADCPQLEIERLQRANDELFRIKQRVVIANRDLMYANKKLAELIEARPHDKDCPRFLANGNLLPDGSRRMCNCWKLEAARCVK
jgi:hypothetical protein